MIGKIKGYKCFNEDLTNRYGQKFEVGKTYHVDGEISFGNNGNGLHMCTHLEDTLRYFDARNGKIAICEVTGFGTLAEGEDDFYEFYDMYACEYLSVDKLLTREEIIAYGLNLYEQRTTRFISLMKLNPEEKELFKEKYKNNLNVMEYIAYYQEGDTEVFKRKRVL